MDLTQINTAENLEIKAVYNFLQSHIPTRALKKSSYTSFLSLKTFEERIEREFEQMANEYLTLNIQAKELASLASNDILRFVMNQLEFKLESWENKKDKLLKRYSTIANIFAFVGLCLVVCGKVINDPELAIIGLLISFSGGVILITSIVTILRKLGIEAEIFRYLICLLKQAQV